MIPGGFVCTAAAGNMIHRGFIYRGNDMSEIANRLDELEDEIEALQLVIKRAQDELARLNAEHHRLCDGVGLPAGGNRDR
jgi:hypothetical protein